MGYNTHYLGRLDITPALSGPEIEWLRAYAEVLDPRDSGYDLPLNPRAERADPVRSSQASSGSPGSPDVLTPWGRCDWKPCVEGCCLQWREAEKSNNAVQWLQHMVDHFLSAEGLARGAHDDFEAFTFDHVVNGVIAAERGDTRKLFLIRAVDNVITTETLVAGDPSSW